MEGRGVGGKGRGVGAREVKGERERGWVRRWKRRKGREGGEGRENKISK